MADKGQIGYSNNKNFFWLNEGVIFTIDSGVGKAIFPFSTAGRGKRCPSYFVYAP